MGGKDVPVVGNAEEARVPQRNSSRSEAPTAVGGVGGESLVSIIELSKVLQISDSSLLYRNKTQK